jgi:hypothetical protein
VLWQVLMLALLIALGSALPLILWHNQQMNASGVSRATAIANWLAAEAGSAMAAGQDIDATTTAVLEEPGVIAARILMLDGRVIAPAARSAERVEYIPGVEAAPGDVLRLRWGWSGDRLEVVRPISVKSSPRAALAWVTLTPTSEFGGTSAVVTAPIVLLSLVLGWIVARMITSSTLKSLGTVNEDIELALSGRIDALTDPLGAKPVKDLTDTINYLVARLRGGAIDPSNGDEARSPGPAVIGRKGRDGLQNRDIGGPRATAPRGAGEWAARPSASPRPPATEARLTVNPTFQVIEAGPGCADILGVRPDALIGRHMLDAIPDRAIADAVLGCLSGLPLQGERRAPVTDTQGRRFATVVSRSGKDQPIAIVLRLEEQGPS